MIHSIHMKKRRLSGKSNANVMPLLVLSFGLLATGLLMFLNQ